MNSRVFILCVPIIILMATAVAAPAAGDSAALTTGVLVLSSRPTTPGSPYPPEITLVDIHVKDAEVGELMRVLARRFHLNILFPPGFGGACRTR